LSRIIFEKRRKIQAQKNAITHEINFARPVFQSANFCVLAAPLFFSPMKKWQSEESTLTDSRSYDDRSCFYTTFLVSKLERRAPRYALRRRDIRVTRITNNGARDVIFAKYWK